MRSPGGEITTPPSNHCTVKFDAVPTELKQADQWVLWKYEERDGKRSKVPHRPDGTKASSTDASTWSTYETVKVAYEQGGYDGVGFVLGNGFTGVDLDHCRDPTTGEIVAWAKEIIDRLNTYSEVSPSGEGVHCILRGRLPVDGRRKTLQGKEYRPKAAIEMYSSGRYFTVTGDRLE
jgi:putative DNA primase/helicase